MSFLKDVLFVDAKKRNGEKVPKDYTGEGGEKNKKVS
jgi:hypothetical protein